MDATSASPPLATICARRIEELRKGTDKATELQRRQQTTRKLAPGELSNTELRSLERNTNYQIARALRSQGESYPVESADRANSLTQAVELLRRSRKGTPPIR